MNIKSINVGKLIEIKGFSFDKKNFDISSINSSSSVNNSVSNDNSSNVSEVNLDYIITKDIPGITYDEHGNIMKNGELVDIFKIQHVNNGYGGDQNYFINNYNESINNPEVLKIIKKYFPDATKMDITALFRSIRDHGCSYVAIANILLKDYQFRQKEFEDTFGYPMYNIDANGNITANYDKLILDLFCFNNKDLTVKQIWKKDGLNSEEQKELVNKYIKKYNVKDMDLNRISVDDVENELKKWGKDGKIIIDAVGFDLKPIDNDGNVMKETIKDIPGHAMVVTGITRNQKTGEVAYVVSSWGKRYICLTKDADFVEFLRIGSIG